MQSTISVIDAIVREYPNFIFVEDTDFAWNPTTQTIAYNPEDSLFHERLFHEIGHAQLGHTVYETDIELLRLERNAWQYAKTVVAPLFSRDISTDTIEDDLDTYRDWLHARSLCPTCKQNGVQTDTSQYTCLLCQAKWRVNTAIGCALRRYIQKDAS